MNKLKKPNGKLLSIKINLTVKEILYDYHGVFSIHTIILPDGKMGIVHWATQDNDTQREMIIPLEESIIEKIKKREISLLEAYRVDSLYLVDKNNHTGEFLSIWQIEFKDLDETYLPNPGAFLPLRG